MQERNSIKFQVLRIRTEGTRDLEYVVSIMVNMGGTPSKNLAEGGTYGGRLY
jgi:hypothetical protein